MTAPPSWPTASLGELVRVKHGFAFKGEHFQPDGDELVLTPGNFRIGGGLQVREGKERYYSAAYPPEFKLNGGDLLIAMTDLTQNSPILGSPLVVPADRNYLHNQRLGKIEILDRTKLDPGFAYFLFASDTIRSQLRGSATGSTVRHTAPRRVSAALFRLPPLATQCKIAAILSAYDDLIENNNRRIKLLEEMAQRIYREWFVDFRYPGHEKVPIVDSEVGPIPQGWVVHLLSELVSTQYGYTESATIEPLGPHFLRGMDINKTSYVDWSTVPYCPIDSSAHARYRLSRGDVVVIRMADPGKVGIVESDVDAVFASYLIRVRPENEHIAPYFLFYFLSSDRYQSFVTGASTGTTRKSLSAPLITSISLATPPMSLQHAFVACVEPLRNFLNSMIRTNASLRATRDLLLPRLISGEIDVTDLDIAASDAAA